MADPGTVTETPDDGSAELAAQIRAELTDVAPQGFHFTDHVIRQDAALERLTTQLREHTNPSEVEAALCLALDGEKDRWTLLKLLELAERLALPGFSPALMRLAQQPPGEDPRARFLSGRASEVLLRLPLDYATRLAANEVCKAPLEDIARYRMGAAREQRMQRPRRAEWALLAGLMAVFLIGLAVALLLK